MLALARLQDEDKFDLEKDSPFGLPKVKIKHSRAGSKSKKAAAEETPAAEGEEATEEAKAE